MPFYAIHRCDACSNILVEGKCEDCDKFGQIPGMVEWIQRMIAREILIHERDKNGHKRLNPTDSAKHKNQIKPVTSTEE